MLAGCAAVPPSTPSPSPSVSAAPEVVPYACWGIREPDCGDALARAIEATGAKPGTLAYGQVQFLSCPDAGCPDRLLPGTVASVALEPREGTRVASVDVPGGDGGQVNVRDAGWTRVAPPAGRAAAGVPFQVDLGHCGFWSGIAADGSFWDPTGFIDINEPITINSGTVTVTITEPDRAVLATADVRIPLVRRNGTKWLPGCA
jgi:hypothetical protein